MQYVCGLTLHVLITVEHASAVLILFTARICLSAFALLQFSVLSFYHKTAK